jgi:hypothetical protein
VTVEHEVQRQELLLKERCHRDDPTLSVTFYDTDIPNLVERLSMKQNAEKVLSANGQTGMFTSPTLAKTLLQA